jgi:hypothetical protein
MNLEDSIIIREFRQRLSEAVYEGGIPLEDVDIPAIENDLFRNADIVPALLRDEVTTAVTAAVADQERAERELRDSLSRDWDSAFNALDRCIAFGGFLGSRFLRVISSQYELLRNKDPRRRPDGPDQPVTGATLKCFLLISLYARSCCIASEISCLLQRGLLGGAQSRLRSLQEQTVIITLLCNDHTYEIAERYQDHACCEALKELRAYSRAFAEESIWEESPGREGRLARLIARAEQDVHEARSRWGREIAEQYGWARPAVAGGRNLRRQITFSDLGEAAGADFLRGDYLSQNNHVHAGSYAAINHLMESGLNIYGRRDDEEIRITGSRTVMLLEFSSHAASKAISFETEEYDEMLYACEMTRTADIAHEKLRECYMRVSRSADEGAPQREPKALSTKD